MYKKIILSIILSIIFGYSFSQEFGNSSAREDEVEYKHTWVTGGGIGLQFGQVTMVDISPQVGYFVNEYLLVGLGLTYQYASDRTYANYSFTTNVYGGSLFARFYMPFYKSIFLHGQYEYLLYNTNVFSPNLDYEWINVQNVLVGAGFRQHIGGRSGINIMVLWNLNQTDYTLYQNPIIRIGFDIGI